VALSYVLVRVMLRPILGKSRRNRLFERIGFSRKFKHGLSRNFFFSVCRFLRSSFLLRFLPHEESVSRFLLKIRGKLFVDVGANVGFYSLLLHRNFGRVVAVEPHPRNMRVLKENARSMGAKNITCVTKAVSEKDGNTVPLFSGSHDGAHSLLRRSTISSQEYFPVETITLSSLLKDFERVDLVKVDVEGAEWEVLEGAVQIIDKIETWVIELHDPGRKRDLEQFMKHKGFCFKWLDDKHIYARRG